MREAARGTQKPRGRRGILDGGSSDGRGLPRRCRQVAGTAACTTTSLADFDGDGDWTWSRRSHPAALRSCWAAGTEHVAPVATVNVSPARRLWGRLGLPRWPGLARTRGMEATGVQDSREPKETTAMTNIESTHDLKQFVEGSDGIYVIRGSGNCRAGTASSTGPACRRRMSA